MKGFLIVEMVEIMILIRYVVDICINSQSPKTIIQWQYFFSDQKVAVKAAAISRQFLDFWSI